MGKIVMVSLVLTLLAAAQEEDTLEKVCLACHQQQQIPDMLIYKRYLMQYSTDEKMSAVMMMYLKDPKKEHSIMPAPFFLKFPMKEKLALDDETLKKSISAYLQQFSMKKKLILSTH